MTIIQFVIGKPSWGWTLGFCLATGGMSGAFMRYPDPFQNNRVWSFQRSWD